MWGFILLVAGGAHALRRVDSDIPPYVQARSAFAHSRLYLQENVPQEKEDIRDPIGRQHIAFGIVAAVTGMIARNHTQGHDDALAIVDQYVPMAWENYAEVSRQVNDLLAEAHAKIQPVSSLINALCRTTDSVELCNAQVNDRIKQSDAYVQKSAKLLVGLGRASSDLTARESDLDHVSKAYTVVPYLLQEVQLQDYRKLILDLAAVYNILRKHVDPYFSM